MIRCDKDGDVWTVTIERPDKAGALTRDMLTELAEIAEAAPVWACELRSAVARAKFFYPVMKLGFLPQPSDPPRLAKLVGPARAKLILMAGQKIPAEQAYGWGLVDQIVDADVLHHTALALGADVLSASPGHIAGIKAMTT